MHSRLLGTGIDLFEVGRMARELADPDFPRQLFTPREIAECAVQTEPARHFAARFAAKEAVVKALAAEGESGTFWKEIEILAGSGGEPQVVLSGRIRDIAERLGVTHIHISLSHTADLALAAAVAES